ncbi:periplasmic heavy metal sensor [Rhodobacter sp. Har01]|uniref:periplasmic heavy metal sensor n=1 Tax=Rhodobacter sp. Har01 TaxID=2883999 RepID=UPI001D05EED5|nr:periplasmic heavy metal sensor [Rhodobacter sp. Har01]MCB6178352.1 periplasmic heavy metal sensor [Rhodobacter sp. Har01]
MSDAVPPDAPSTAAPSTGVPPSAPRTAGWVKALLALSLALNLAIAGLAAGAYLRDGGPPGRGDRDFGFGPLGEALSREDRKALRLAFLENFPALKDGRAALRGDFGALIAVLRADPLDPAALDAALATIAARNAEMLATGRDLIARYLKELTPAARAGFADRLDKALTRAGRREHRD